MNTKWLSKGLRWIFGTRKESLAGFFLMTLSPCKEWREGVSVCELYGDQVNMLSSLLLVRHWKKRSSLILTRIQYMGVGATGINLEIFLAQLGGHKLQKKDNFTRKGGRKESWAGSFTSSFRNTVQWARSSPGPGLSSAAHPDVTDYGVQEN